MWQLSHAIFSLGVIFVTSLNICLFVFVPGTAIPRASRLPMHNRLRSRGWLKGPTRDTRQKSRWTGRQTDLSCESTGLHMSVHPEWFDNTLLIPFVTYHSTWVRARNFLKCQALLRQNWCETQLLTHYISVVSNWVQQHGGNDVTWKCSITSCSAVYEWDVEDFDAMQNANANVDKLKSSTFRRHEVKCSTVLTFGFY